MILFLSKMAFLGSIWSL